MGLLGDYRSIMRQSKELSARQDVAGSMSAMQSQLESLNASMGQRAVGRAVAHGVAATATITAVEATGAVIDFAPACRIELLVMIPGRVPMPVSHWTAVPQMSVGRARPGEVLSVRVMPEDPNDLFIDWSS